MRLKNKVALVTAAASGIGRAGCEIFAAEGAKVIAVDVDGARLEETVAGIRANGGEALAVTADLLSVDDCHGIVQKALGTYGRLDVLWNHAGMTGPDSIETYDAAAYSRTFDLNLRAGIVLAGAALPGMREQGGGSIIFTSSVAGLVGSQQSVLYSAAKFGVIGTVKALAVQYARHNIRVNAVCPGMTDTPMMHSIARAGSGTEQSVEALKRVREAIPMGRAAEPREIAFGALYFASDESTYTSGAVLAIDGAYTSR